MILYLDVETMTDPTLTEALVAPLCEAPRTYKTTDAIAGAMARARQGLNLDPDTLTVICAGLAVDNEPAHTVGTSGMDDDDYAYVLTVIQQGDTIVGFNVAFDLRAILRTAELRGLTIPRVRVNKYRLEDRIIDLQAYLSYGEGPQKGKTLDWYCRRFGLTDMPEDEISGADVPALAAAGDWPRIVEHAQADVMKTRALAQRLRLVGPTKRELEQSLSIR